ncbi:MAG: hypothetical protein A2015_17010 [Spirochaetes bacterium GWF1_31_7]|nr:MAG: hypothetical protein A2Y30_14375 [Spirochaetes bacterium GWE1_32_154]OHD50142.1 MAG: hypothetical protein A2Y29_12420 [Spirochaetes bacterium GWE2_31_10]OHD52456.1 MAG: hypothetical protein A2015_17010 [Spirochaetes bacterium GWF1_31_7]OHD81950.1 MAG: hypothetical protein A2355_17635 [Spirochaetes bacterium RIFOXYB1_FULL_32_8]HBD96102.1 gfo/Idh/MocA family oxidoreductase [Spirochaetia bacterium]
MRKYTAAIVGTGRIGYSLQKDKKREQPASHSSALYTNKNIRIIAGVDADSEKLKLWQAEYYNAKTYNSIDEMLAECTPDIITVAVNESSHHEIALKAIKAQPKLVVLEKPVALTVEQANQIKEFSLFHKVPVMINHERRFSIDYQKVKKLIQSDGIGTVESIYASLSSSMRIFNKNDVETGNYSLIHDGTHLVDIVHFLTNTKLKNPLINRIGIDNDKTVRYLSLSYDIASLMIHLEISGARKYFGFDIDIRGTKGRVLIGNGYLQYYTRQQSPFYTNFFSLLRDKSLKRPRKTCYFSNMIQNAVDFLDGKQILESSLDDGISALLTLKEIESILIERGE